MIQLPSTVLPILNMPRHDVDYSKNSKTKGSQSKLHNRNEHGRDHSKGMEPI